MATRVTIIVTDSKIDYANAKNSKTLLGRITNSSNRVRYIFNMYDSGDLLFEHLKEITSDKAFKYYWQYGNTEVIATNVLIQLIGQYNKKIDKWNNIGKYNHHGVHMADNYYVDSEYIYWFDWYNKELKQYETHWDFGDEINRYWEIDKLTLLETIPLEVEKICDIDFDYDRHFGFNSYYYADVQLNCTDCINCKLETSSDEHCYCEYFNDYFLKSDSKHSCDQWELR